MASDSEILHELNHISALVQEIPPIALYLAGCCRSKSSLSISTITSFLKSYYSKLAKGLIPPPDQEAIEILLYQGQLAQSKEIIKRIESIYEEFSRKADAEYREIDRQVSRILTEIKEEEQKAKNAEPCGHCASPAGDDPTSRLEICGHLFHSFCLNEHIECQISAENAEIACPVEHCEGILTYEDIERSADPRTFSDYEELFIRSLMLRGSYRESVVCSNCSSSYSFGDVCHVCSGNARPCPLCTEPNAAGDQRIVKCRGCNEKYCFHCGEPLTKCECGSRLLSR